MSTKKPNIVLVMADQLRYDLRKSKGYPLDTMPFLDSLSGQGLEFDRAYTPNPTCMPARVSLFTGRYPSCHNVRTNHNAEDAVYTEDLTDVLHDEGYLLALCGKNHSHLSREDFDWWETNGHLGAESEQELTDAGKSFDAYLKTLHFCDSEKPSPFTVKEQLPYRNVSSFFRFADKAISEDRPFFAWVSFAEPHNPYQVPYPYYDMFTPDSLPEITTDLSGREAKYLFMDEMWSRVYSEDKKERILRDRSNYLGMLRLIDDQLKRLYEGLNERNLLDDTLVIFVSDHGEFIGEYGLIRKGCGVGEILSHVPMVMYGHGVERSGHEKDAFVSLIDIFPTICNLLGVHTPFGVQGKNLLPLMQGKPYPERDFRIAYSETGFGGMYWDDRDDLDPVTEGAATDGWKAFDCLNTWTQAGTERMIRKGDYEFIADMMGNYRLYDISSDPLETQDLSDNPDYFDILMDMSLELNAVMMRASDPIPSCKWRYRTKIHPDGYWFDESYHVKSDPGVEYHPVNCPKRRTRQ